MIDRATVDRILDAAKIVDVVGEFVTLRKSGVNYKGLCPFHDDRNPSFMVSPVKNICHCFVCGKGGTPAGFLMEHEQMTYPDALRWLAKKYNIEVVEKELTDEERAAQNERESMFIVNEWARDWFHSTLKGTPEGTAVGLQYFRSRAIRDDIIEKFQLGYAPQRRDSLCNEALKKGYKKEFLVKTGLCIENERGIYDRYSGRAIFPWLNVSGKVVAFGGRVLDSRTKGVAQKYVNSPDSDIYHKERELYGIYQAKRAIAKEDRVFMVEGYTDVIAMHQAGIENVVANSGTALSEHQIRLLHRFTQNITLLYDGDEAGIHAAMRGTDMLLADGMNVKVLLLPDGDDPDSFARKHSIGELRSFIEQNQTDFITFKTKQLLDNVTDPIKRSEAISSIARSISVIPEQVVRDAYVTDCAHRIDVKEAVLIDTINKYIRRDKEEKQKERERAESGQQAQQAAPQQTGPGPAEAADDRKGLITPIGLHSLQEQKNQIELLVIREVVRHGEEVIFDNVEDDDGQLVTLTVAQYVALDLAQDDLHFSSPLYQLILDEAAAHSSEPDFKAETYFTRHPDPQVSQLATKLVVDRYQLGGRFVMPEREGATRQRVLHLVKDLRFDILDSHVHAIQQQMKQAGQNNELVMQLMKAYMETKELRDAAAKQLGNELSVRS